jgi:DNA polymerase eta
MSLWSIRLNIPLSIPLCVQQWNGLIAVNYAARKFGIERHSSPVDAKKKCPGNPVMCLT